MIKAIIFDCFGVIYPDTLAFVERRHLSQKDTRKSEIRNLRKKCDIGLIDREEFWNEVAIIMNISRAELESTLDEVRGADWELLEYVKLLKETHKTAMLSNVGKGFLERIFDEQRPSTNYFDCIIASGDIGHTKPDARAYLYIAKRLGVDRKECLMVDDSIVNCRGAEKTCMKALLYSDFETFKKELKPLLK